MQQMENQDGNKNKRDAINGSYLFITLFNGIFGAAGFLLFDKSVCTNDQATAYKGPCDNILSSISGGSLLDFVKILVSVDLLFTIPLILAASRAVIEDGILDSALIRDCRRKWLNRLERKVKLNNGHQSVEESNNNVHVLTTGFNHTINSLHFQSPTKSPIKIEDENGNKIENENKNESDRQLQIQYQNETLTIKNLLHGFDSDAFVEEDNIENGRVDVLSSNPAAYINNNYDYGYDQNEETKIGKEKEEIDQEFSTIDFHVEDGMQSNPIHKEIEGVESNKNITYDSKSLADDIKNAQELLIRNERFTIFVQYMVRSSLVIAVILMAVGVPGFGDMVALVGGFVCSFTGFFLPPIIYIRLRSKLYHLHLPPDQNNQTTASLTHNVISRKLSALSNLSGESTPPLTFEMCYRNNTENISGSNNENCNSNEGSCYEGSTNNEENNKESVTDTVNNSHGVTYEEKEPMSRTFLLLHFLIMIFGLLTMINTVIFTIVNINGRKEAEGQIA